MPNWSKSRAGSENIRAGRPADDRPLARYRGLGRPAHGIRLIFEIFCYVQRQLLTVSLLGTCCFSPYLSAQTPDLASGLSQTTSAGSHVFQPRLTPLVDTGFRISIPNLAGHAEAGDGTPETVGPLATVLTLERVQQLRQEGAYGLALALLQQTGTGEQPDWLDWERQRWAILKAAGLKAELVERLRSILPSLEGDLKVEVTLEVAALLLILQKPRESRAVIRQMWASQQPAPVSMLGARRLVIQAYLAEGLLDDADVACDRYQADYYPDDPAWNRLRATLLLRSGKPGDALRYLAGLQDVESKQLRSLARLREGSKTPQEVLSRMQAMRISSQQGSQTDRFRLAVLAEAAERGLNWLESASALEVLLAEGAVPGRLLAEVNLKRLLRVYQVLGDKARQELTLDGSAFGAWSQTLAEQQVDGVTRRAIYLSWYFDAGLEAPSDELNQALVRGLLDDRLAPLVFLLYGTDGPLGPVTRLADDLLHKLSRYALQRRDYSLASTLNQASRTAPEGMNEGEWALRRSRVEIFAGHAEPGLDILLEWLGQVEFIAEDSLDRVIQVLFDLQTIGRHDLAMLGFQQVAELARTPRQQRELLYWMAESQAAQGEHSRAADLFLRSAVIGRSRSSQWGQSARFRAASELASAGLINDARTLYRALLEMTSDPKQRLALGQKIQDLDLQAAWGN